MIQILHAATTRIVSTDLLKLNAFPTIADVEPTAGTNGTRISHSRQPHADLKIDFSADNTHQ